MGGVYAEALHADRFPLQRHRHTGKHLGQLGVHLREEQQHPPALHQVFQILAQCAAVPGQGAHYEVARARLSSHIHAGQAFSHREGKFDVGGPNPGAPCSPVRARPADSIPVPDRRRAAAGGGDDPIDTIDELVAARSRPNRSTCAKLRRHHNQAVSVDSSKAVRALPCAIRTRPSTPACRTPTRRSRSSWAARSDGGDAHVHHGLYERIRQSGEVNGSRRRHGRRTGGLSGRARARVVGARCSGIDAACDFDMRCVHTALQHHHNGCSSCWCSSHRNRPAGLQNPRFHSRTVPRAWRARARHGRRRLATTAPRPILIVI
jgi:hypothetical protein